MAEKRDSESEDELGKCIQNEFRINKLDANKPGSKSSMVNVCVENKSSSEDLADPTGVKVGECKPSYEEPRDSKVTDQDIRAIESVNETESDGKLADGKLGEKKLTDTELASDKPALVAVAEVKPINLESSEEKPPHNQTVEYNQTDIESWDNSELGKEKSYDREKCEENKNQEEKKKQKITVSGIKQYIEFFKERLMLYQFIQSLEDEDFFKFANELEGKSYIEKGFTDKMIQDLEEEIPRVRDSMEKRRNQRIAEEKEKKRKHEEAKRKFQEHLKKQHKEEEKRRAEQEAKEMKEWEERRAKWRAIMNRTEEEKRKRLEEIRAQEKAKTKESSSDDDEEEDFVEIQENEISNKEGNESQAKDKIEVEVQPSPSESLDDKEFEQISEKELVHIEQNESLKEHETKVVELPQIKQKLEEETLEDVNKENSKEQDHQETHMEKKIEVGDEKGDNLTTRYTAMEDGTSKEEEDDVEEKVKELSEEEQKKLEEEKKEEERKKEFELEERRVYLILWTERTRKRTRRLRLLKKMQEKKLFTPGNMDQVVKIATDAGLSEELVNHVVERPVIPSLLKYVEKLELSKNLLLNFIKKQVFKAFVAYVFSYFQGFFFARYVNSSIKFKYQVLRIQVLKELHCAAFVRIFVAIVAKRSLNSLHFIFYLILSDFFISILAVPRPTLGHSLRDSLTLLMLIAVNYQPLEPKVTGKGHWEHVLALEHF